VASARPERLCFDRQRPNFFYLAILALIPAAYPLILLEERELKQRYGEEYESYLESVPRLIPRWR